MWYLFLFIVGILNVRQEASPNPESERRGNDSIIMSRNKPSAYVKLQVDAQQSKCIRDVRFRKRSSDQIVTLQFSVKNPSEEALLIEMSAVKCWPSNKKISLSFLTVPGFDKTNAYREDFLISNVELNLFLANPLTAQYFDKDVIKLRFTISNKNDIQTSLAKIIIKNVRVYCQDGN